MGNTPLKVAGNDPPLVVCCTTGGALPLQVSVEEDVPPNIGGGTSFEPTGMNRVSLWAGAKKPPGVLLWDPPKCENPLNIWGMFGRHEDPPPCGGKKRCFFVGSSHFPSRSPLGIKAVNLTPRGDLFFLVNLKAPFSTRLFLKYCRVVTPSLFWGGLYTQKFGPQRTLGEKICPPIYFQPKSSHRFGFPP